MVAPLPVVGGTYPQFNQRRHGFNKLEPISPGVQAARPRPGITRVTNLKPVHI
jgi:hypothetical protein